MRFTGVGTHLRIKTHRWCIKGPCKWKRIYWEDYYLCERTYGSKVRKGRKKTGEYEEGSSETVKGILLSSLDLSGGTGSGRQVSGRRGPRCMRRKGLQRHPSDRY